MTQFYWVRHGPTHAKTMVGWTDLPADLSDTSQLQRLSAHLPDSAVVISSDLLRARATADAIQGGRRRLPDDPDLREIHFGAWENKCHAAANATHPELLRAFWENAGDVAAPDGESWNMLRTRISCAIDRLMRHDQVIVVAHFGAILSAIQNALICDVQDVFAHKIDNLSVTEIHVSIDTSNVIRINQNP